jgi:glucose-1-phosphate cytidylyltransferase
MPILWHIMKIYSHYGFKDFVLCLGYKGDMIKRFFLNYEHLKKDFTINIKSKEMQKHGPNETEDWNITFANTGETSETGCRIKKIEKYIDGQDFFLTYGDGLCDINIAEQYGYHKQHGKIATVTSVRPTARFGLLTIKNNQVVEFTKKTFVHEGWIDGGFFVMNKKIFNYLSEDENCMLEREPLQNLAKSHEFMAYKHNGFWQCMDTIRDHKLLNEIWNKNPPWKVWK